MNTPVRVVLLTKDSIYSRIFLTQFLHAASLEGGIKVVGVFLSTSTLQRGAHSLSDAWAFVRAVGPCYALYQAYVCWLLPTLSKMRLPQGISTLRSNNINAQRSERWVRNLAPDFVLSFHFNQKILPAVANIPTQAALNFHPSYLPNYRGVDPVLFALQTGAPVLGASIHQISAAMDAGDIYLREIVEAGDSSLVTLNKTLFERGARMAASVITHFAHYDAQRLSQKELPSGRYDAWAAIGRLGCMAVLKAVLGRSN